MAWGTDFQWTVKGWSNERARGYRTSVPIRDPYQLRLNAYRVLLTRGRDGTVVFVPMLRELNTTHARLAEAGFLSLDKGGSYG